MQVKNAKRLKKILIVLILTALSLTAGDVALVGMRPFIEEFTTLETTLKKDGHRVFAYGVVDTFVNPDGFDVYWIFPDYEITDMNISQLVNFVESGGHLILVSESMGVTPPINRILQDETWYSELGMPESYQECVRDSVPDIYVDYFGFMPSSFILNFDSTWSRIEGIDTLITMDGVSVGLESDGCLRAVGWGARDCYGHPYSADTAVYDSFAVQILAGFWHRGEITVVGNVDLFATFPDGETDIISLFDNLRFARQLFACNQRADSLQLSQTANTVRGRIFGDFSPFNPDSSKWKYRFVTSGICYHYRGWELAAYYDPPDRIVSYFPSFSFPITDSMEVCLELLPDYDGETVLWNFPICDTFWFDYDGIAEAVTPEHFAISAYPNPFNSAITISLSGGVGASDARSGQVGIEIYDISGRLVADLPVTNCGEPQFVPTPRIWRPDKSLGSGVYLIRARFGDCESTKRIVYLK